MKYRNCLWKATFNITGNNFQENFFLSFEVQRDFGTYKGTTVAPECRNKKNIGMAEKTTSLFHLKPSGSTDHVDKQRVQKEWRKVQFGERGERNFSPPLLLQCRHVRFWSLARGCDDVGDRKFAIRNWRFSAIPLSVTTTRRPPQSQVHSFANAGSF